ncbi:MAG TPA: flagellar hook-associated protein FlgK [Roseateles sp.]
MSMIYNGLSGALAAQTALNTNSQNIANAMTPGYVRQGVLLSTQSQGRGANAAGGVTVSALLRFSDGYKSLQMWSSASSLGQFSAAQPYLTQLEQVMSDDASNINQGFDAFFAALNAASTQPDSGPLRDQVITAADGLARRFDSMRSLLDNQSLAMRTQRGAALNQINGYTADIAQLNREVAAARAAGLNDSALLDARDRKVDALASLVGLQTVAQPDGTLSVSLRGGQPLVVGADAGHLGEGAPGMLDLSFGAGSFKVLNRGLGGQLGGLQDYEDQTLGTLKTSLDELAKGFADSFNAQHQLGFSQSGVTNQDLFTYAGDGKLTLNPLSGADLAFSSSATALGDSANLQKLVNLRQTATVALSTFDANGQPTGSTINVSLGDVYTQLVGKLGVHSQQNQASQTTAQTVRDQADESWKSTSGVNTDEEAIALMQYKQMYESNMKVIAVANELFDSTLAMLS